jgi:hypothetical protein
VFVWANVARPDQQRKKPCGFSTVALAFWAQDTSGEAWRGGKKSKRRTPVFLAIGENAAHHDGPDFSTPKRGTASSQVFSQVRDHEAKCLRNGSQIQDRDVALATLDRSDKGPVQPAPFGEFFLCQPARLPPLPEAVAQFTQESFVIEVHCA